jgi:N-acetylglucosamine-6-sulfatase
MYFHNIKASPALGRGGACMHTDSRKVNENTFAKYLQAAGYTVGMFGKYLNKVPTYVPPGFDAWLANGGGDYYGPAFATLNAGEGVPDSCPVDGGNCSAPFKFPLVNYTTSVVGNLSIQWIRKVVDSTASAEAAHKPFFAYVAPKAAHEPFNPAPWYEDHWDASWPAHEPRPVSWNCSAESRRNHHGNIATEPLMTQQEALVVTGIFKNRWRALMSVDDVIAGVMDACAQLGVANDTYFFYSSDRELPACLPAPPGRDGLFVVCLRRGLTWICV